jgi:hypothetical protein
MKISWDGQKYLPHALLTVFATNEAAATNQEN